MSKQVSVIVMSCQKCPYCRYDGHYDRSTDSGYDCKHDNGIGRIVDDYDANRGDWPAIPATCPLPDYEATEDIRSTIIKT